MKRDHKLITVFAAVAVLAVGAVGVGITRTDPPPPPLPLPPPPPAVVSRDVATGPDGVLSVQFVGDTMLGDAAQPLIDQFGYDWPLQFARESLTGDFVVATAEAPISTITLPWNVEKKYSYSTRPEAGRRAGPGRDRRDHTREQPRVRRRPVRPHRHHGSRRGGGDRNFRRGS